MELGEHLREYRAKRNMTQQAIADELQIDKSTYAHYEAGKRVPNAKTWVKLTRFMQLPVFPAKIAAEYPDGMLDEFENIIEINGTPIKVDYEGNTIKAEKIHVALIKVMDARAKSIDTSCLPVESLFDKPMPQTIANVTLDMRGEYLIKQAMHCYDELLRSCGFIK